MIREEVILENPYLDIYNAALEHEIAAGRTLASLEKQPSGFCTCYECIPVGKMKEGRPQYDRHALVRRYSFAVPNDEALSAIAGLGLEVMEIGAGTGYWAALLEKKGVSILPFDCYELSSYGFETSYTNVYPGKSPEVLEACKFPHDFALMLCWPEYAESMAIDALNAYRGDTLIYIGEPEGGCTADDAFFEELEKWREEQVVQIPQWYGIHDYLGIYRRTG